MVAQQVTEPRSLLLPAHLRPQRLKRSHCMLDPSYARHVSRCVKAGLQRLAKPSGVWKHQGKLLLGGAFAVAKNATEDRVISDVAVNQLVDPLRVIRPQFAYPLA